MKPVTNKMGFFCLLFLNVCSIKAQDWYDLSAFHFDTIKITHYTDNDPTLSFYVYMNYDSTGNLIQAKAYPPIGCIMVSTYRKKDDTLFVSYSCAENGRNLNESEEYIYERNTNRIIEHYYYSGNTLITSSTYRYDQQNRLVAEYNKNYRDDIFDADSILYSYDASSNRIVNKWAIYRYSYDYTHYKYQADRLIKTSTTDVIKSSNTFPKLATFSNFEIRKFIYKQRLSKNESNYLSKKENIYSVVNQELLVEKLIHYFKRQNKN